MLAEMHNRDTKCDICMPVLHECNHAVAQIWLLTQGQIITAGMGDIVDINHIALWKNIEKFRDIYEIENETDCFLRVVKLFHYFLEIDKLAAKNSGGFDHEAR